MPEDCFLGGCRLFGHGLEREAKGNRPWEPSCSSGPSLARAAVLILTSRRAGLGSLLPVEPQRVCVCQARCAVCEVQSPCEWLPLLLVPRPLWGPHVHSSC